MNATGGTQETSSPETLAALVRQLKDRFSDHESVAVGRLLALLGVHSFVFLILILALLNLAIFMLPGLSILFGVPMVILVVQILLGLETPVFPVFVRERTIEGRALRRGLDGAWRALSWIEPALKPRWPFLTSPLAVRLHALLALLLAFMVAIPVPFLNLPPTVGIALLALGLLQRDGLFILGGYLFAGWSLWLYESLGRVAGGIF